MKKVVEMRGFVFSKVDDLDWQIEQIPRVDPTEDLEKTYRVFLWIVSVFLWAYDKWSARRGKGAREALAAKMLHDAFKEDAAA